MNSTLKHIYDLGCTLSEQAALSILKKGRCPKHVGFILDGNRRYAKKIGATSAITGHYEGFKPVNRILKLCNELGIFEITLFVFSIENFNRSQEEVNLLMDLFRKVFGNYRITCPLIMEKKIKVQFIGDLNLLPKDLAEILRNVMETTKNHIGHEMATSIKQNIQLVNDGILDLKEVNHKTIEEHLLTSLPLELLVRTSHETRLSDFLLYQAALGCQIHFIPCYWPEITFWKMLCVFLEYQIYYDYIPKGTRY